MCLNEINKFASDFKEETRKLKDDSPYYPSVLLTFKPHKDELIATTLVRIKRNDIWYAIHCVERHSSPFSSELLLLKINQVAYMTQLYYKVSDRDEPDESQIEEIERCQPL